MRDDGVAPVVEPRVPAREDVPRVQVVVVEARRHGRRRQPLAPGSHGRPHRGDLPEHRPGCRIARAARRSAGPRRARRRTSPASPRVACRRRRGRAADRHAARACAGAGRTRRAPRQGLDQADAGFALAERRAAVRQQHPAPPWVGGDRRQHLVRDGAGEELVERDLEGRAGRRGLQPHRAIGRRRPEHRRPRPQVWVLDLAGALDPGSGELRVQPRHRRRSPRRGRPRRDAVLGPCSHRQAW